MATRIYKDSNKVENYSPDKLRSGVLQACLAVQTPAGAAKQFADSVESRISAKLKSQKAMTLRDLKRITKNSLNLVHPDAAEIYALEEEF